MVLFNTQCLKYASAMVIDCLSLRDRVENYLLNFRGLFGDEVVMRFSYRIFPRD